MTSPPGIVHIHRPTRPPCLVTPEPVLSVPDAVPGDTAALHLPPLRPGLQGHRVLLERGLVSNHFDIDVAKYPVMADGPDGSLLKVSFPNIV